MSIREILKESSQVSYQGSVTGLSTASATTLEPAYTPSFNYGYIGNSYKTLCNVAGGIVLANGVHFQYDKRLDKSVSEDATYGFGTIAGGIFDTSASGAFASGKCLRIVENGKNITDATGLNLKIMAKYMPNVSSIVSPPYDYCYIDPISRLFILPQPIYWSKFESAANITTTPEINTLGFTPSISIGGAGGQFYDYTTGYGSKFGNALVLGCIAADYYYGGTVNIKNALTIPKGTISMYWGVYGSGRGSNNIHNAYLNINNIVVGNAISYNSNSSGLSVGGTTVGSGGCFVGNGIVHVFLVWDADKGLTNGNSVRLYINGSLLYSTSNTIATSGDLYLTTNNRSYGIEAGIWDNFKLWNYANEAGLSAEYNGGAGIESAYDTRYGGGTGIPLLTGASSGVGTAPITITGTGGLNTTATSDDAVTLINASGNFGSGGPLFTNDLIPVTFSYNKRLDASTTDDPVDGYGTVSGGMFDTGVTGSLASNKYFRITNNGVNVKSLTGVSKVYAKNLSTLQVPPANSIYVDPVLGKYVMPQPIYWSKCESVANLTTPEIGLSPLSISLDSTPSYVTGNKFGNGVGIGSSVGTGMNFNNINFPSEGTISFWNASGAGSGGQNAGWQFLTKNTSTLFQIYWNGVVGSLSNTLYIVLNGSTVASIAYGTWNTIYHFYVVWSAINSLSGGKSVRLFANGIEVLSTTTVIPSGTFSDNMKYNWLSTGGVGTYSITDNIKIWNHVIEDPSFEYNSGTGRESALHPCYGSGNNYKPSNNTVRYYRLGGDTLATIDEPVTLTSGAIGKFGPTGGTITDNSLAPLTFQYDKRLDNTADGGIDVFDTGITGSLASGKYFRITINDVNAKSLTGITQVVAKNLSTLQVPSSNSIYVDPTLGKYVMPQPIFWAKMENGIPEIGTLNFVIGTGYGAGYVSTEWANVRSKFGKGFGLLAAGNAEAGTTFQINPVGISTTNNQGIFSFWYSNYANFGTENFPVISIMLSSTTYITCNYNWFSGVSTNQIVVDGIVKATNSTRILWINPATSLHWAVVYNTSSGIELRLNNISIIAWSGTFSTNFYVTPLIWQTLFTGTTSSYYTIVDNIKHWSYVDNWSDIIAFEYNGGTGNESALHPCYGSPNYTPANNTVRYYKSGSSNNKATIRISGN